MKMGGKSELPRGYVRVILVVDYWTSLEWLFYCIRMHVWNPSNEVARGQASACNTSHYMRVQ